MEQSLQGVSFPNAAAAKAKLLHNHDTTLGPCSLCSPYLSKPKSIVHPWMGFGDGKEMIRAQDQMMKQKRGGFGLASTRSVANIANNMITLKHGEKFELEFLRHDGHFLPQPGQKKGPMITFVNQYFRLKWRKHTKESQSMSRSKRLDYAKLKEKTIPVSKTKRLEYTPGRERTQPMRKSKSYEHATTQEESQPMSKSKRFDYTIAKEETEPMSMSKRLGYAATWEESKLVSKSKGLDYTITREETRPVSKRFDYATVKEETKPLSMSKRLEHAIVKEELEPISRSKRSEYTIDKEETQLESKIKSLENARAKVSQTLDYGKMEVVEAEDTSISSPKNEFLPCGTDCNQVRTKIFRKVNSLMARAKPERLHIKARPKTPTFNEQDEYEHKVLATGHQAVQTIFTENKKVQTSSGEPKQVQWAILPRDNLSPKVTRLVNDIQKTPNEMQFFRDDSILMKVAIAPENKIHAKDPMVLSTKEKNSGRGVRESPIDSPCLPTKRMRGQHHLLLYQEALEIANEQKDLERAREQRRDFWASYEQELKRGRGLHVEDCETERKGKRTIEEETPSSFEEDSISMKKNLNTSLDEHLTLTSTSRVSSSSIDESKSSQDAAAVFQQLLDKMESYETSPKGDDLVGLQGLRKAHSMENLHSLESMEKQLNPETSQPPGQLSPTELDCMKAAILSHNFYPRLVTSFINQHKVGAPPDQVERLETIRNQVINSWHPSSSPIEKPADEEKIKKYQDILTKFERELEKPFRDAMDFSWQMEHYFYTLPPSRGRSEVGSNGFNNLKDFDDELYSQRGLN